MKVCLVSNNNVLSFYKRKLSKYLSQKYKMEKDINTVVVSSLQVEVDKVFANGPGDLASSPGRIIPKTLKMVLDTSLLNTQQYKVHIKGKVEQSRERSSTLPYTSV